MCVCVSRYGLGMIYYKQEKFNLAEIHFKKALSINPQSSVLLCHIGVVCFVAHEVQVAHQSIQSLVHKNGFDTCQMYIRPGIQFYLANPIMQCS